MENSNVNPEFSVKRREHFSSDLSREIAIAPNAGACFGVVRAIKLAEQSAKRVTEKNPVYALGALIHNPQVVSRFQARAALPVTPPAKLVVPRTVGEHALDAYCESLIAAGRSYDRGDWTREEYDRARAHLRAMIAAMVVAYGLVALTVFMGKTPTLGQIGRAHV